MDDDKAERAAKAAVALVVSRDLSFRKKLWEMRQRSTINIVDSAEEEEDQEEEEDDEKEIISSIPQMMSLRRRRSSLFSAVFKTLQSFGDASLCATTMGTEEDDDDSTFSLASGSGESDSEGVTDDKMRVPAAVPFSILGLPKGGNGAGIGERCHDCVLTPPLMDALLMKLPRALRGDNYWLKYSMLRDGASIETLLSKVRTSSHCIIAIETADGRVLGSFTSSPWRKSSAGDNSGAGKYFGSCEAFLWRLARSRYEQQVEEQGDEGGGRVRKEWGQGESNRADNGTLSSTHSSDAIRSRADLESEVEVFPWSGSNRCVQMTDGRTILVVGGGEPDEDVERRVAAAAAEGIGGSAAGRDGVHDERGANEGAAAPAMAAGQRGTMWDFGLALNADLSRGSTGRCATFMTPVGGLLSADLQSDANTKTKHAPDHGVCSAPPFEITNVDVWTLTPMFDEAKAEKLEMGRELVLSSIMAKAA